MEREGEVRGVEVVAEVMKTNCVISSFYYSGLAIFNVFHAMLCYAIVQSYGEPFR